MAGYTPTEGRTMQAFWFDLDLSACQEAQVRRFYGARRFAYNWCVAALKDWDRERRRVRASFQKRLGRDLTMGESEKVLVWLTERLGGTTYYSMAKRFTIEKRVVCVNSETGDEWWPEVAAEVFNRGIEDACAAYQRWRKSLRGDIGGRPVGFPRFARRGRTPDRFRFGSPGSVKRAIRGRHHLYIPKIGRVRTFENMRRLERLHSLGRVKIRNMVVRRVGDRHRAVLAVDVLRPQSNTSPAFPDALVGIDLNVSGVWIVVGTQAGEILHEIPNPEPLEVAQAELRKLQKKRQRQDDAAKLQGRDRFHRSNRRMATSRRISKLHAHIKAVRANEMHKVTSMLVDTYGRIHIEDLNVAGMMQQKGLSGARKRRRRQAGAAFGEIRRQLEYKAGWYGSEIVVVDRFFASTKTCSSCGELGEPGWLKVWKCRMCSVVHDRDRNAAINVARWGNSASGAEAS